MTSKFKLREPITGLDIERAQELCSLVIQGINQFQTDIYYHDSNQLFDHCLVDKLKLIAKNLDELIYILLGLVKPNSIHYAGMKKSVSLINTTPNVFIITAHYLNPENKYKRLLNKYYFDQELEVIKAKLSLVIVNLEKMSIQKSLKRN
ncbi:hypothetical protein KWF52_04890 [Acinetobacter pittii]|uniref:hypothetical protein n=1 Tax=Acinetobacter TaxID=469 RepID=UPI000368D324|nr:MULTISPECIES: hypothetical protein [Acinetobacter]MDR0070551.1 hypothetical protein [Acinetobacter sp. 11520]AVZ06870.1 hypothetical protein DBQ26_21065 [Acinetobacter pittii]EKU6417292.1 hypothetical protein [Acinetobacter baumannii]EKW4834661.1 hypothetical protein [Acinetobacter baumannii]EKX1716925.1 hypothetical protein [Acinetobacter baumannii]